MSENTVVILDNRIKGVGELSTEAFKELHAVQTNNKQLLKTGQDILDDHIGTLLPSDLVVISGAPSSGKSQFLYDTLDLIMSEQVNPNAKDFVSLEYSMEIKMLNKVLRKANTLLNKKKSDILFNSFNEDEKEIIKKYHESLQDSRRFSCQSPVTPHDFYKMTRDFCLIHKDKSAIVLSADHALLFTGSDKQGVLEQISEYINLLRLEFGNLYIFLLSQTNRSSVSVIKEKDNVMMPNNSQLFGSSFMEQLASYIVIITNPFKLSINQYLKVSKDRYDYLSDFFGEEDSKGRVSFNTTGNLFFFVTKMRESDQPTKDLYIRRMNISDDQFKKMQQSFEEKPFINSTPTFTNTPPPIFEDIPIKVTAFSDLKNAFDNPVGNSDSDPF